MLGTITITVGQRESEDVKERDRAKEMAASSTVVDDITKDEQEETPEMVEQLPASEGNVEEMAQPAEAQANDVGFKKVFKFVGFKFTVKKDKNEKSDAVQLLTVKKEEGEGAEASVAAGDHQEPGAEAAGESASKESELKQSTEKQDGALQPESLLQGEPGQAAEEDNDDDDDDEAKEEGEEKPTKSPESPTSPVSSETTSSFKKFFTHGWAGWRKKTSFKKAKEEDLETSEKRKEQEADKADEEETEKTEPGPAVEQEPAGGPAQPRLSADYEKVELPLEDQAGDLEAPSGDKCAPLATEVFDEKMDAHQEVVAEVHVSTVEKTTEEQGGGGGEVEGDVAVEGSRESLPPGKPAETQDVPQDAEPAEEPMKGKVCVSGGDHTQLRDLSPEEKGLPRHPEGIVSEVEMLSSQERIKAQGSPLKKLFSSSGLKKLSGKKQKGKRGGGGGDEELEYQHIQSESPESADEQKGESSASSPDEPEEEITSLEKAPSSSSGAPQEGGETEEGATSDGEKKREGITPWASFKKMVTPKKRVRRPSESDKEEELDKVKSATLSSTESTASEMQDEPKAVGDEQRPEEPKRRVDTSVSWEALICVGSSKKRARKASSSDDEGGPRTLAGDSHRAEEASKDKDAAAEAAVPASAQEQDQAQGSSSPEPAGSPSEGEGVSTWESFKRLVTPRKKSKSKLEEKPEDAAGVEPMASEIEPSKEESWVSIKKFIPGRRKKRADGKQEHAAVEDSGPVEISEDDPDVPAVVPLSEYDAVERDKMEAQRAQENVELPRLEGAVYVSEELSKTLVHTVSVAVVDGTRAVPGAEERSPSWISASVTEPLDHAEGEAASAPPVGEVTEKDVIAEETPARTQALPEDKDDAHDVAVGTSEVDLTSEAVTAAETTEALRAEEVTEASGAEETADMVSAVSQLSESPDTTEEATPVQEAEGGMLDTEEQERQTQAVLQAAADKVKEGTQVPATQTVQRAGLTTLEKVEELEEDSEVLATEKEEEVPLQGPGQEGEHPAQGSEAVQATPESLAGPEVTTRQAVKPQQLVEQAAAPESSETLTDSETNGSTPLAESDTPDGTQQDEPIESQERKAIAACVRQSQVTEEETAPAQEGPSTPPDVPAQEEHGEKPGRDVLELTQQALAAGAVPDLAKAQVGQEAEAGQTDGEEVQDGLCVKELEVSVSQEIADVTHDGEATEVAGCQENESPEEQSLSPEEREAGTDVEKEKMETKPERAREEPEQEPATPELGGAHPRPGLPVDMPHSESGKALGSLEGSSSLPDQDEAGCIEVQSSDTPVPQTDEAVKKVVTTVAISETDASLECVGARLLPAEKSPETGGRGPLQHGGDTGPESQAESIPIIVTPAADSALRPDLQGDMSASQKQRSDENDKPDAEGQESTAKERVLKAEPELLELQSKSSKIVQNVIQTAVDQFARAETAPETRTSDSQTQAQADGQGAPQMLDKDESCRQVPAQGRTPSAAAQEGLAISDGSEGLGKASETINTPAVESARVKESVEKLPVQSKDQKEHAADGPQLQSLALAEADASGNVAKESPDATGPKLTEEGDAPKVEVQEEEMNKAQTEEDLPEPKGDLAES